MYFRTKKVAPECVWNALERGMTVVVATPRLRVGFRVFTPKSGIDDGRLVSLRHRPVYWPITINGTFV